MGSSQYSNLDYNTNDPLDPWHCPVCFLPIAPSRPPILNSKNCTCERPAAVTSSLDSLSGIRQDLLAYDEAITQPAHMVINRTQSSSSKSFRGETGLEKEHHHSPEGRISFAMDHFLHERSTSFIDPLTIAPSGASEFLQPVSTTATKGKKSIDSVEHSESISYAYDSSDCFHAWTANVTTHVGDWANDEISYPSYISDGELFSDGQHSGSETDQRKEQVEIDGGRNLTMASRITDEASPFYREIHLAHNKSVLQSQSSQADSNNPFYESESGVEENQSVDAIELNDDDSVSDYSCFIADQNQSNLNPDMLPNLSPIKQKVIDQIIDKFWTIFNYGYALNIISCKGEKSDSSSSQPTENSESEAAAQLTNRKHARENDDNNDDDNNEENCAKRFQLSSKLERQSKAVNSCVISHWPTVARVKCWFEFKNREALEAHLRAIDTCPLSSSTSPFDGITADLEKKLRSRKKESRGQSEADRWRDIYRLLFPGEEVPSPYLHKPDFDSILNYNEPLFNSEDFTNFMQYSRQELPRLVKQALEHLDDESTLKEYLRNDQLIGIIKNCQEKMFTSYKQKFNTSRRDLELESSQDQTADTQNFPQYLQDIESIPQEEESVLQWESFTFMNPFLEHNPQQHDASYFTLDTHNQPTLEIPPKPTYTRKILSCSSSRPYSCDSIPTLSLSEGPSNVSTSELEDNPDSAGFQFIEKITSAHNLKPAHLSTSLSSKDDQAADWYQLMDPSFYDGGCG
ncbi:hypothetical protein B7463_g6824, partial [Scytalidium lignicola]